MSSRKQLLPLSLAFCLGLPAWSAGATGPLWAQAAGMVVAVMKGGSAEDAIAATGWELEGEAPAPAEAPEILGTAQLPADAATRLLELWNRVPADRREQLLIGSVAVWRQASPQNKQRLIQGSLGAWTRSTPQQKDQIRQGMRAIWQGASPPQRNALAGAMAAVYDEAKEPEKRIIREEAAGELAQYLAPGTGLGGIAGTVLGSIAGALGR